MYKTYIYERNNNPDNPPQLSIDEYSGLTQTLLGGKRKRSPLREGWSLDNTLLENVQYKVDDFTVQNYSGNLTMREIALYKKSEDTTTYDGDTEFYILGSFLAELFHMMSALRSDKFSVAEKNPHDLLLHYIERYGGARRGIISPLLGFFYGIIVQTTTQDGNSFLNLGNRLEPYNGLLNSIGFQTNEHPSLSISIKTQLEAIANKILQKNNFKQPAT